MSAWVVDASVVAKWFFTEVHTREALRLLRPGMDLAAPDFLLVELDSLVCKRIRRGEIAPPQGRRVRNAFRAMPIATYDTLSLLDSAYEIALGTRCSIYDCLYVALAVALGGRLVTADRRLYEAMEKGPLANHLHWIEDLRP